MDDARLPEWRTALVVQAVDERVGRAAPVVVGLVDTAAGGVQVALRVGDDEAVFLPLQDATQLALNLNETRATRLEIAADALGGDEP